MNLERLLLLEEKEARRKASTDKSKQRPEYKNKVKEYNKKYYEQKKEKKQDTGEIEININLFKNDSIVN